MVGVIGSFFSRLLEGDPVALVMAALMVGLAVAAVVFWKKVGRDAERREERQRPKKAWKFAKK